MNEFRNSPHMALDLCVCLCVCLFPGCVCVQDGWVVVGG